MRIKDLHEVFLRHPVVSTDSRNIPEGCIFFALRGPNFDGNAFAKEALGKGAAFALVDDPEYSTDPRILPVENVLEHLQQLATYHRHHCDARIISLTGSNGKTTTKELIAGVLRSAFRTQATSGNLNNHIGVPLTLLRIREDTEFAVVEMGANHQGEIALLSSIAQPDFGYITNFGKAHLEGFGGVEGVIKGKSELYRYLMAEEKTIFMNADDPKQRELLRDYEHKIGFSTTDPNYALIENLGADPHVGLRIEDQEIRTQLMGAYNFSNCAAAALIGKYFNVPLTGIKTALEAYRAENNRSQILLRKGLTIFLDAYNANPSSMEVALNHFASQNTGSKIAILGDMFELGEAARAEHMAIGKLALSKGFDSVYLVGANFDATGLPAKRFPDFDALAHEIRENPIKAPANILIKGSRGMALERILNFLPA